MWIGRSNKKKKISFLDKNKFISEFTEYDFDYSKKVEEGSGKYELTNTGIILLFQHRVLKKYKGYNTDTDWQFQSETKLNEDKLVLNYYYDLNGFVEANHTFLKDKTLYYDKEKQFLATKEDMLEYMPCMDSIVELWRDGYISMLYPFTSNISIFD